MSVPQIVKQLRNAAKAYYETAKPLMSDADYDTLVDKLRMLAPDHAFFKEVGATPSVGVVNLPFPMPSLDKRKPEHFAGKPVRGSVVVSDKLDGISALWVTGYTATPQLLLRGNGLQGQDVTPFAKGIQGLSRATCPKAMIRGELIVPKGIIQGTLARNWVNGQLHQKVPQLEELKQIHFVAYQVCGNKDLTRSQQMTWLGNQGFEIPWFQILTNPGVEAFQQLFKERRETSKYECDGLVVGTDTVPETKEGCSNPSDAFAFKMTVEDQKAKTTVRAIEWNSSRHGIWVPRILFDPVQIGTATIEACTGVHAQYIQTHQLGPGAEVLIRRSGDVIPTLDTVLKPCPTGWSQPPEGRWKWDEKGVQALDTTGEATAETLAVQLTHTLVKLGIEGISKTTAKKLVDSGLKTFRHVYKAPIGQLQTAIGPGNGQKLRTALDGLAVPETAWLEAYCGWPKGFGSSRIEATVAVEPSVSKWSQMTVPPKGQSMTSFAEVQKAVPAYLAWRAEFGTSASAPVAPAPPKPAVSKGFYVMTGFRDADLQAKLAEAGWTLQDRVTKATTVLLVADGGSETTKVKSAREAGVKIVLRSQAHSLLV